jgi:hypothetical protein
MPAVAAPLPEWGNFYLIIGGAAAALTGLQFVVITLAAETRSLADDRAVRAFGTPTIVHFGAALLISAIGCAPWHALGDAAFAFGAVGVTGTVYTILVIRDAVRQTAYEPVLEDWLFHAAFPQLAYAVLVIASLMLRHHPGHALFAVGAAALALLLVGIHNAYDAVTYFARQQQQRHTPPQKSRDEP